MDFAVVRISGKQYVVSPDQKLEIEGRIAQDQKELTVSDVLLCRLGDEIKIGAPTVSGMSLTAKVLETSRGDKVRVSKFKAKSRYRRTNGFRPYVTTLQFGNFSQGPVKSEAKPAKVSKAPSKTK